MEPKPIRSAGSIPAPCVIDVSCSASVVTIRTPAQPMTPIRLLWRSILLAATLAAATAVEAAPKGDIRIDDTGVYPESLSASPDGAIYIGSIKGVVFRAPPGASVAKPWIRPTAQNGILSILGVLADAPHRTLLSLIHI